MMLVTKEVDFTCTQCLKYTSYALTHDGLFAPLHLASLSREIPLACDTEEWIRVRDFVVWGVGIVSGGETRECRMGRFVWRR